MRKQTANPSRTPKDWPSYKIIAALRANGTTLAAVSRAAGYNHPSTLWNAIDRKWPKGERLLAAAIGVEPAKIWPSRYPKQSTTPLRSNQQHVA